MYVELVCDVSAGEEFRVCYGKNQYRQDTAMGKRMSNAIVV